MLQIHHEVSRSDRQSLLPRGQRCSVLISATVPHKQLLCQATWSAAASRISKRGFLPQILRICWLPYRGEKVR